MFYLYDFERKDNDNFCYMVHFVYKSNKKNIISTLWVASIWETSTTFANDRQNDNDEKTDFFTPDGARVGVRTDA